MMQLVRPRNGSVADLRPGPSANIWWDCPRLEIRADPSRGCFVEENFRETPPIASTAGGAVTGAWGRWWSLYAYQGATLVSPGLRGGGITIASDGDNEGLALGPTVAPFKITRHDGRPLWFEGRLRLSTVADTKNGVFVGLIEAAAVAAGVPIATSGALADKNLVGFHRLEGDGDYFDTVYKADGQTQQTVQADAVAVAADVDVKLGLKWDGVQTLTFYKDGVPLPNLVQGGALAAATFPHDVTLGLVLAILNATGTTPGSATPRWIHCYQLFNDAAD